ncbi:MAG: SDR family NAD(P)-dependent oxidoreductase [Acetobacteraceae bacterium]|nr:SDR family NAD(P)-dependent oxidoreductase [Acetobacteraceae bacterium]
MTSPVAVVTGATSGIGRWIALGVARAGFRLVLPARSEARGQEARAWIAAQHPGAEIELLTADFASLASTAAVAAAILERHPALGLLVNNAGVFRARAERTAEGHDLVLAVNHLAPHRLMHDLRPALLAGAPSRIMTVGSSTSDRARIDPAHLDSERGWTMVGAYATSKLAVMMSTFENARLLAGTGVTANVVHPGMVATGLIRSGGPIGLAWRAMRPFIRTEEQGAMTPLHVALSPDLARTTGRYFKDRQPVAPNKRALDPVLLREVWEVSNRLSGCP